MLYGAVAHCFLFNYTISTYIQAVSCFITWNEAVWHWWSVVYAVFSTGGDLAPVQSQLVEDLSNFCDSCPMCQRGMLDSQSGFAETTDSERFREIQRDSERFREIPLQHKRWEEPPFYLSFSYLFMSPASPGATHRAALGFTVQDPSLLAKLR